MPEFLKKAERHLSEDARAELAFFLASHPESGEVMAGTGGVRKVRWGAEGRGKRGGVRVIYCWFQDQSMPLIALDLFAKNEKANLTRAERNELRKLVPEIAKQYQRRRGK